MQFHNLTKTRFLYLKSFNFGCDICISFKYSVADLEGVQGVRSNPPSGAKLFRFHGEFKEILSEIRLTNPPFLHLNPLLKNPGSPPDIIGTLHTQIRTDS